MNAEAQTDGSNQWWRWVVLPFATIIGSAIGTFLISLLQWFGMKMQGGFSEDGWYFLYIMPVISSAVFGWLYAYIACEIAPKGKVVAGTVMVTVLGFIAVLGLLITWMRPDKSIGESIQITLGSIATMVAAVLTLAGQPSR